MIGPDGIDRGEPIGTEAYDRYHAAHIRLLLDLDQDRYFEVLGLAAEAWGELMGPIRVLNGNIAYLVTGAMLVLGEPGTGGMYVVDLEDAETGEVLDIDHVEPDMRMVLRLCTASANGDGDTIQALVTTLLDDDEAAGRVIWLSTELASKLALANHDHHS